MLHLLFSSVGRRTQTQDSPTNHNKNQKMTFYIFRCKSCGKWGVKEVRIIKNGRFNCKFCRKTFGIKSSKTIGLALQNRGPYQSALMAGTDCARLNKGGRQ